MIVSATRHSMQAKKGRRFVFIYHCTFGGGGDSVRYISLLFVFLTSCSCKKEMIPLFVVAHILLRLEAKTHNRDRFNFVLDTTQSRVLLA